ncbi:hypothetical protein AVEN_54732-1 [Araneus ventricosus]|uniref:Uncharacterized protein n=1 Tax=Araneus ventricosus TaxID=182803 RepID=A0A4Y2FDD4_ARAVE|nr:hypothetical protein AVEN_54732-1 [Araneus ventricosus]
MSNRRYVSPPGKIKSVVHLLMDLPTPHLKSLFGFGPHNFELQFGDSLELVHYSPNFHGKTKLYDTSLAKLAPNHEKLAKRLKCHRLP